MARWIIGRFASDRRDPLLTPAGSGELACYDFLYAIKGNDYLLAHGRPAAYSSQWVSFGCIGPVNLRG
jgi:hypothetical protein